MKKIFIPLCLVFCVAFNLSNSSASYAECADVKNVKAVYAIESYAKIRPYMKDKRQLVFTRFNNLAAHEFVNKDYTDVWSQTKNNRLKLTRYFDKDQRAIEYEPYDVQSDRMSWTRLNHLVGTSHFKSLQELGDSCTQDAIHNLETKLGEKGAVKITWQANIALPKELTIDNGKVIETWSLVETSNNTESIKTYLDKKEMYQSTDYADIGDNETDPFLLNMVNLGFVDYGKASKGKGLHRH